ncbi:hypothetical protein [Bifidobacterium sp.]|jgi:type IV secretion system protein TrbL|uniref:TrbL/VirB6 plasmid conjugal transfer protein n=2 Tax=Bifidobacterium mongoliense TaxID=518643 RepID=A0A423UC61_9BIFI|nr:hypothetical protein [Bifidobacterium sp.]MCI1225384.1 hypothetical protein [Bifidobacterium sp.]ROT86270.1 hypothetical protein BMONG18_1590 [Bifidobacterium mongoliense]
MPGWMDDVGSWFSSHSPADLLKSGVGKLIGGIFDIFANLVSDAVANATKNFATMWMNVPTPDVSGTDAAAAAMPDDVTGLSQILGYAKWIAFAIAGISIIILAVRFAMQSRRGDASEGLGRLGMILVAVVIISASSGLVSAVLATGPTNVGGVVAKLQNHLWYYMMVAAVLSIIIGMCRLLWQQRAEPGQDTLQAILRLVVVAGAGTTIIQAALKLGDAFSTWIINSAADSDFGTAVTKSLVFSASMPGGAITVIVIGLFCLIASIVQIILMIFRSGLLVVMTGVLPLASANTNTDWGMQWYHRSLGWIAAFILYKPAASIIYATCFWMISGKAFGSTEGNISGVLVGFSFMVMAIIALPALMKFAVPAVSSMASGGSGGGAAAALPSGAMMLARSGSSKPSGAGASSTSGASQAAAAPSGGSAAASGAGASSGAAAGAGAAAGPVGVAAAGAVQVAQKAKGAVQNIAEDQSAGGSSSPAGATAVSNSGGASPSGSPSSQGVSHSEEQSASGAKQVSGSK